MHRALRTPTSPRRRFRGTLARTVIAMSAALTVLGSSGVAHAAAESYALQSPGKAYSYSRTTSPNGAVDNRFELRRGDQWANDTKYNDGRQRINMRGKTSWANNTDVWFAYSFRWSGSMPSSWTNLTNFHSELETGESAGKPGPLQFLVNRGRLDLQTRSDTRAKTTSAVPAVTRYSMPMFPKDTWQNIVVRIRFDPNGQGRLTFWLNGTQKYDSGSIPLGYNDVEGPYFKYGIYRGASDLTTVTEFANVEVGTGSLSGRIANPKPLPN